MASLVGEQITLDHQGIAGGKIPVCAEAAMNALPVVGARGAIGHEGIADVEVLDIAAIGAGVARSAVLDKVNIVQLVAQIARAIRLGADKISLDDVPRSIRKKDPLRMIAGNQIPRRRGRPADGV